MSTQIHIVGLQQGSVLDCRTLLRLMKMRELCDVVWYKNTYILHS